MNWVVGPLQVVQVALRIPAIGWRDVQRIVAVDVAQSTRHVGVTVRQRESGRGMIENARSPRRDRVTRRARGCGRRETCGDVIWHRAANRCGALKCRLVAAVTIRRAERVIVVHMAGRAGRRCGRRVRSGQRKSGNAVIECRRRPAGRRMAVGAIRRGKSAARGGGHGSRGLLPGGQMALRVAAIGRRDRQIVVVVDVAQRTGHVGMPAGQREPRRAVVERCRRPTDRRVAGRAVRECKSRPGRWMNRIRGLLPGGQMASGISAIGRRDG